MLRRRAVFKRSFRADGPGRVVSPLLTLDVAQTSEELSHGLRGRKKLEPNIGMLFVFPNKARWPFWMKGVPFPLDLAWLDEYGWVSEVTSMRPGFPVMHYPKKEAASAVELPYGYLAKHKITSEHKAGYVGEYSVLLDAA